MVQIGIGTTEYSKSYEAIDLEESNTADYSIDSGDDSSRSGKSIESELEECSLDKDEEIVSDEGNQQQRSRQRSKQEEKGRTDEEQSEISPDKELKRSLVSSIAASEATKPSTDKSISPASPSKKASRRVPSYGVGARKSSRYSRDKKGTHMRLATDEKDAKNMLFGNDRKRGRKRFMRNPIGPTRTRDPTQFPLEQYTDAEYGINDGPRQISYSFASSDPNSVEYVPDSLNKMDTDPESDVSYSYTTSDPSSINYDPKKLKKMKVKVDGDNDAWLRKIIYIGFITALMLVLVTAILVAVTKNQWPFIKAPKHLEEICNITNILTEAGHKKCENVCKPSSCCSAPGDDSCFLDHEEMCSMYAPCGILAGVNEFDGNMVVPPPPSDLKGICSATSVATTSGYIECQSACHPGQCCLIQTPVNSDLLLSPFALQPCSYSHEDICHHYEPCNILDDYASQHGSAVDIVNAKCTNTNMHYESGREDCENACEVRSCCFSDARNHNCRESNEVWCDEFAPCNILFEYSTLSTGGGAHDYDHDYEHDHTIQEKCKDKSHLTTSELEICQVQCSPSMCCFYDDLDCKHIDCDYYEFCREIMTMFDDMADEDDLPEDFIFGDEIMPLDGPGVFNGPPVSLVSSTCNDKNEREKCHFLCAPLLCCFQDDYDEVSCVQESVCSMYSDCTILETDGFFIDPSGFDTNTNPLTQTSSGQEKNFGADEVCDIEKLMTSEGVSDCENLCEPHLCCFDTKKESGCVLRQDCPFFEACGILVDDAMMTNDLDGNKQLDIAMVCSYQNLASEDSRKTCENVCSMHECCVYGSCPENQNCPLYEPCSNLHDKNQINVGTSEKGGTSDTYIKPPVDLADFCRLELIMDEEDDFFEQECLKYCEPAFCCNDDTCPNEKSMCYDYRQCIAVWDVDSWSHYTSNVKATSTSGGALDKNKPSVACEMENKRTKLGKQECENVCEEWTCCWSTNNCFEYNEDICLEAMTFCREEF